jgi:hypothetical protein
MYQNSLNSKSSSEPEIDIDEMEDVKHEIDSETEEDEGTLSKFGNYQDSARRKRNSFQPPASFHQDLMAK